MKEPKKQTQTSAPTTSGVDFEELERVLILMQENGLEEFEYVQGGLRIRLRKPTTTPIVQARAMQVPTEMLMAAPAAQQAVTVPSASAAGAHEPAVPVAAAAPPEELHVIKSPIVGTFYGAPNPEAAAFVKVGDAVKEGQTICIIEAMKLMNEIESDVAGEVVRILIENGQPVEYGEPLFELRPAKKKK